MRSICPFQKLRQKSIGLEFASTSSWRSFVGLVLWKQSLSRRRDQSLGWGSLILSRFSGFAIQILSRLSSIYRFGRKSRLFGRSTEYKSPIQLSGAFIRQIVSPIKEHIQSTIVLQAIWSSMRQKWVSWGSCVVIWARVDSSFISTRHPFLCKSSCQNSCVWGTILARRGRSFSQPCYPNAVDFCVLLGSIQL